MRDGDATRATRELIQTLDHVLTLARGALGGAEPERSTELLLHGLDAISEKVRELRALARPPQ
jgi:hypothetical protein